MTRHKLQITFSDVGHTFKGMLMSCVFLGEMCDESHFIYNANPTYGILECGIFNKTNARSMLYVCATIAQKSNTIRSIQWSVTYIGPTSK
jgi:hypothetical protein